MEPGVGKPEQSREGRVPSLDVSSWSKGRRALQSDAQWSARRNVRRCEVSGREDCRTRGIEGRRRRPANLKSEIRNCKLDRASFQQPVQSLISDFGFKIGYRPFSKFVIVLCCCTPDRGGRVPS